MKLVLKGSPVDRLARRIVSLVPYRHRLLDSEFHRFARVLADSEAGSLDAIRRRQFELFRSLVRRAYTSAPFYLDYYNRFGFHPDQLRSHDDISRVPAIDRDDVRREGRRMVARDSLTRLYEAHTSGTTGTPLTLWYDRAANSREWAAICHQWQRIGYAPGEGRVELRGFVPGGRDLLWLPDQHVLRINIVTLSEKNLDTVAGAIARSRYRFFHGYPSAMHKLVTLLERCGIELSPSGCMLASEVLHDWQLAAIRRAFPRAKIIAHYGQAERVALGAWCEREAYHFLPLYGLVEIDPDNGCLIGSSLTNVAMPLVRYRLSDVAEGVKPVPDSGEATLFPIVTRIAGRIEDLMYRPDGTIVPPAVVTFPFKKLTAISSSRLVQHAYDRVELQVSGPTEALVIDEAQGLVEALHEIFGEDMTIEVTFHDNLPTDPSGKFRWIESRIQSTDRVLSRQENV